MYLVHLPHHRLAYSGGTQVELWTPARTTCISNCRANNSSTSRPLPHKRPRPPLCPRYVATTIDPLYASSFSRYCLLFNFIQVYSIVFFHPIHHYIYIHLYIYFSLTSICAGFFYALGRKAAEIYGLLIFLVNQFRIAF